jgi:L-lysine exporter family protein LysE/ArgO
VLGKTAALTWLNPNVYLDTMFLLGSIANTHGSTDRWGFAVGAGIASALWFSMLGFGSSLAAPLLARPRAWQALELGITVVVLVVAARLAFG